MSKTFMQRKEDVVRNWYVVDATDVVLGRLSTEVATVLKGKQKPTFTPHVDGGDYVVVVNADKVTLTGNKQEGKLYYRHSGHYGGLKTTTAGEMMAKFPDRVIELAIKGMLPKGTLGANMLRRLYVYAGNEHPHAAQKPMTMVIKG